MLLIVFRWFFFLLFCFCQIPFFCGSIQFVSSTIDRVHDEWKKNEFRGYFEWRRLECVGKNPWSCIYNQLFGGSRQAILAQVTHNAFLRLSGSRGGAYFRAANEQAIAKKKERKTTTKGLWIMEDYRKHEWSLYTIWLHTFRSCVWSRRLHCLSVRPSVRLFLVELVVAVSKTWCNITQQHLEQRASACGPFFVDLRRCCVGTSERLHLTVCCGLLACLTACRSDCLFCWVFVSVWGFMYF